MSSSESAARRPPRRRLRAVAAAALAALAAASAGVRGAAGAEEAPAPPSEASYEEAYAEERQKFVSLKEELASFGLPAGEASPPEEDAARLVRMMNVRQMQGRVKAYWKAYARRNVPLAPEERDTHKRLFRATLSLGKLDARGLEWLAGKPREYVAAMDPFLEARDFFALGETAFDDGRFDDAVHLFRLFARRVADEARSFGRRFHRVQARALPHFLFLQMSHYRAGRPAMAAQAAQMYLELAEGGVFDGKAGGQQGDDARAELELVQNNLKVFEQALAEGKGGGEGDDEAALAQEAGANQRFVASLVDAVTSHEDVEQWQEALRECREGPAEGEVGEEDGTPAGAADQIQWKSEL